MHEYSIVQALVERIEDEALARGAFAVDAVTVRIGEMSGVDIELLTTAYLTFRLGTICEHAPIEIISSAATWRCRECAAPIARGAALRCGRCGGAARLEGGDEILLERVELEVPDVQAATA
jgi:hydrogenase nickel incorporation protein HypA/HybF